MSTPPSSPIGFDLDLADNWVHSVRSIFGNKGFHEFQKLPQQYKNLQSQSARKDVEIAHLTERLEEEGRKHKEAIEENDRKHADSYKEALAIYTEQTNAIREKKAKLDEEVQRLKDVEQQLADGNAVHEKYKVKVKGDIAALQAENERHSKELEDAKQQTMYMTAEWDFLSKNLGKILNDREGKEELAFQDRHEIVQAVDAAISQREKALQEMRVEQSKRDALTVQLIDDGPEPE
jgi:chromosome segregation ATPase